MTLTDCLDFEVNQGICVSCSGVDLYLIRFSNYSMKEFYLSYHKREKGLDLSFDGYTVYTNKDYCYSYGVYTGGLTVRCTYSQPYIYSNVVFGEVD